ncbi:uncharacterized protein LOC135703129 [Ochlerotatus camptorhynchus]|uniref:uncharacterized protein LOC135703129 n=1 Tax=Ochlerotatus camptorhynchus TaxID=644619 RepID=UPI0031D399CA
MKPMKQLFLKFGLLCLLLHENAEGVQRFDDEISIAIGEKGKKQLRELEEKSHLPRYGECWLHALEHLRDGCRMLTDTIQVDLALHFTNCFMEMSGQERLDCVSERTEALKRLCMSEMSDRAFAVYTEFFTQTQNMCFFLQNQRWQVLADQTIDRLSVRSRDVSEQLEVASKVQRTVLEQQKEGMKMQGEMLQLGGHLAKTLNGSQEVLDRLTMDLRNSTTEHRAVLKELFHEFYLLHSWIVGRYAFVDRIVFYFSFLAAVMVASSPKRTSKARSYLILNVMGSAVLEVTLPLLFPSLDDIQKDRIHWTIRKLFALTGAVIFGFYCYRYQDENAKLLNEIKEQNRQIMESILRMKLEPPVALRTSPKQADQDQQQSAFSSHVSHSHESYRTVARSLLSPSTVAEPDTTDNEKENSSNERRSVSRSLRLTPERKERAAIMREPSRTSESSVSHASRYNLRRKT